MRMFSPREIAFLFLVVFCFSVLVGLEVFAEDSNTSSKDATTNTESGFKSLFDGKTLNGWRGNTDYWAVENGAIVGQTKKPKSFKGNTFLISTTAEFDDFELRLQYRIDKSNSGVQFRSKVMDEKKFAVTGYQADFGVDDPFTGVTYEVGDRRGMVKRGERVTITEDGKTQQREKIGTEGELGKLVNKDWNDYTIIAKGHTLQMIINGHLMSEVIDNDAKRYDPAGIIALQLPGNVPMKVEFKNIRIKSLKNSTTTK